MAQTRTNTNLPHVLQNPDAIKALCKRILKLYIVRRKSDWESYTGQAKNIAKRAVAVFSLGKYGTSESDTWRIIDDCDEIKKEIEGSSKYSDLVNLITKLHEKAISAKSEEVPWVSKPSLRTDTFYAIISLVHEMMKLQFPREYVGDVSGKLAQLKLNKQERKERFNTSKSVDENYKNIDKLLTSLVLLGVREVFYDSFGQNRNLFPYFKRVSGTTFITQSDVSTFAQIIKIQMKQETGNNHTLTGLQIPNINIPYQLQPNFHTLYLKKE